MYTPGRYAEDFLRIPAGVFALGHGKKAILRIRHAKSGNGEEIPIRIMNTKHLFINLLLMKTILRGISMRLSLIAMVLCLCAAWPGHGLAWVWPGRRAWQG